MHVTAIIAAAGSGRRMGSSTPKQFLTLAGMSMLERTVGVFAACPRITDIVVVTPAGDGPAGLALPQTGKPIIAVAGGGTRQESVGLGFARVPEAATYVIVHDAARPFVTPELIARILDAAIESGAAIAAMPSRDTVKEMRMVEGEPLVARTIPRERVYLAQTPQAFRRDVLAAAVAQGRAGASATDESGLAELAGHPVRLVEGDGCNLKITTARDLSLARSMLGEWIGPMLRTGAGYDLHRLVAGRPLVLGGVTIPSERGALGHSDADVVCHAATDAILGAVSLGDIGLHFPDSDARWKDARSLDLLRQAVAMAAGSGFEVGNVDVTVMLESPRLRGYIDQIRASLATVLAIDAGRVSVKATTSEGLGFTGRGEGIAAMAVATLRLPPR